MPLYLHPQSPPPSVINAYYAGFDEELDSFFARAGLGWHYETGIQIVLLILAGAFERFPNLKIITGHWGEVMLFYLDRSDLLSSPAKLPRKVSEYVRQHIYVTASGMFSHRYLQWAIEVSAWTTFSFLRITHLSVRFNVALAHSSRLHNSVKRTGPRLLRRTGTNFLQVFAAKR